MGFMSKQMGIWSVIYHFGRKMAYDQLLFLALQAHLLVEGLVCENTSSDVTLDKRGCVTMTSFQSAHGQVAVLCKYSSSETDNRIAS